MVLSRMERTLARARLKNRLAAERWPGMTPKRWLLMLVVITIVTGIVVAIVGMAFEA